MSKLLKWSPLALAMLAPAVVSAQGTNLLNLLVLIETIVERLIPLAVAIALIYFIWGLIKFLFADPEGKETAKSMMFWGIIALFIIVSIGGIISYIANIFDVTQDGSVTPPRVEGL